MTPKREQALNGLTAEELPIYEARFAAKFERRGANECWPWTGSIRDHGYGQMYVNGSLITSHRLAHFFHSREALPSSVVIRHKCDNPRCVNPSHLVPGTQADNVRDRVERGRSRGGYGETSKLAKLTDEAVRYIRASDESNGALAKRFGVSYGTIWFVRKGRNWKHVA